MLIGKKFVIVSLIVIVVGGMFLAKDKISLFSRADSSLYYAVFLTNGQVYFGNLKTSSDEEFVLTDVHYLQLENEGETAQTQLSESRFSLIKMGNEIHGPTDELFINKDSILFYEKLRDDSKVVDSIKQSKK